MQVLVKMPHTKIKMEGNIEPEIISTVKKFYKNNVKIFNDEGDEIELAVETDWFKEIDSKTTPGDIVKIYRENLNLTQAQLGLKLNKSANFISDIENNRRSISLKLAKQLAKIFDISIERFF